MDLNKDILFGIVIGLILMYFFVQWSENCWLRTDAQKYSDEVTRILARQAARWSTAAEQDDNVMVEVLHANYGAGYLWALQDIGGSKNFKRITGQEFEPFVKKVVSVQDKATKKLIAKCPGFGPPNSILSSIGGEGN